MSEPVAKSTRTKILFGVLAAVGGLGAVTWMRQSALEVEAAPLIAIHTSENLAPGVEVASDVVVTREKLLFGTPHAKVEIFVRAKDGGADTKVTGIEYNYVLESGKWRMVDSGGCSDTECVIRGNRAFKKNKPGDGTADSKKPGKTDAAAER